MSDKLSIQNEMRALDSKNREFYDSLTDEERKKFSTFLMMKYGGNVEGHPDLQAWYLRAHNERVNLNFFDIGRHPKLQWLLCTTVSPSMGSQRHYWLGAKKKTANAALRRFIEQENPGIRDDELDLLISVLTPEQIKQYARDLGWDDRKIKSDLSV